MFKIQLPNDIEINTDGSQTILEAALSQQLLMPHSCRNGRCNSCKCRIVDGTHAVIGAQLGLTDAELSQGMVLSCMVKPSSNVVIDSIEVNQFKLPPAKTAPCRVMSVTKLTDTIAKLEVRVSPSQPLFYIPGQYVNFLFKGQQKSYSIANYNEDGDTLVFHIKKIGGGAFSSYIFEAAKENDLLRVRGPYGTFFPREVKNKKIIFLATGTGYGPIRAIIKHLLANSKIFEYSSIALFRGARYREDLYLSDEPYLKQIDYLPTVSAPDYLWRGETRYVQVIAAECFSDYDDAVVFACGSQKMIENAKTKLLKAGVKEANFFSDAFLASN